MLIINALKSVLQGMGNWSFSPHLASIGEPYEELLSRVADRTDDYQCVFE